VYVILKKKKKKKKKKKDEINDEFVLNIINHLFIEGNYKK